jgi:hypothetical protein
MTLCRSSILVAIVGTVVVLTASSAFALPSLQFHQTDVAYSTRFSPDLNQGTIQLLTIVGSGRFVSPSDAILEGARYFVGKVASRQNFLALNAKGDGKIQDDRWKHKKFEKADEVDPPADLHEPPTAWVFGAGLALMIVLVLLRRRHTN